MTGEQIRATCKRIMDLDRKIEALTIYRKGLNPDEAKVGNLVASLPNSAEFTIADLRTLVAKILQSGIDREIQSLNVAIQEEAQAMGRQEDDK